MGGARFSRLLLEREVGDARLARNLEAAQKLAAPKSAHRGQGRGRVVVDGKADVGGARRHGSGSVRGKVSLPDRYESYILQFEIQIGGP